MKSHAFIPVIIALLVFGLSQLLLANDGKYEEAMKKNILAVYTAKTTEEFVAAINSLERIATAEPARWEPGYYTAFGYVMLANREKDASQKDQYLDLALTAINKAKALAPKDSEVLAMEGFIHMIRVTVDPGSRGPQYAPLATQTFVRAIELNGENPRALALLAQMQYGSAQFFGSPTNEACATLTKALEKFDTFKPANALTPTWGKQMAEGLRTQCK